MISIDDLNIDVQETSKNENALMINPTDKDEEEEKKKIKIKNKKKKKKPTQKISTDSKVSSSSPDKNEYNYSALTRKKDTMPKYILPPEIHKLQTDQLKIFNNFFISPSMDLKPDEYNDLIVPPLKKPSILRRICCCESKPKLSKWLLDGDYITLVGETYARTKHKDLSEFEDQAILKKLVKMYKKAPKLENLTIDFLTDFDLNQSLEVVMKLLNGSTQFEIVKQLKISSLPSESLLWVGPQFIHTHFLVPDYNIIPRINPWVEIRHNFKKYIDKGAYPEELLHLLNSCLKKFEKSVDLQLLHLKFSSWADLGDEVVRSSSNIIWKLGFNLRELMVHFCGRKMTDYGVNDLCDAVIGLKTKKLLALGFGFDSRNLEITDISLKKISETLLSVSEKSYLRSVSVVMISQSITDYGLWCLGQALHKIAERLSNMVILLGTITGITDKGVQNIVEGVLRSGKNLKSVSLGFLSWDISKYGLRIIDTNICNNSFNLDLFNLYFSNQGFEIKARQELLKKNITEKHKNIKEPEIYIFL